MAAVAVTAACAGPQTQRVVPAAQPPAAQQPAAKGTLIYAVGDESSFVFSYPRGKLLHQFPTTGYSACADAAGNVFVTKVGSVEKYEHGRTSPVETYNVAGSAYSCSVNPRTQDLAVVVFCIHGCGQEIVILPGRGGHRRRFHVPSLTSLLYCAYDDRGNLFVDGYDGIQFGLAELHKGARDFTGIALNKQIPYAAEIQWDGEDLAIETRENPVIYRVAVSGSKARVVGRTRFAGLGYRATQSWIENGTIAIPSAPYNKRAMEIFFYNYPAGGEPTKILKGFIRGGSHAMIDGVTFSVPV